MNLTDTHTHLYASEFDQDRKSLIESALEAGVTKFFMPNIDSSSVEGMLKLRSEFPDNCFPMMGLHPCSVRSDFMEQLSIAEENFSRDKFFAVGEIGLDLYWDKTFFEEQKEAFNIQCKWAVEKDLPIVIHTRNSFHETVELIEAMKEKPRGIFHCFSGGIEDARKAISLGFYLGIGGVLTFKNSGLDAAVGQLDLKYLVLETDAPYLAPAPFRGKRNEPVYLKLVAEKISNIKGISLDEVAKITTENAKNIFGI